MNIPERIAALRAAMQAEGLAAWVQPTNDPHQSEYVAEHWQARAWLSGFTGSAGTLVVTATHAGLWTDGRYFLQAEAQLAGMGIVLHRQASSQATEHVAWLQENLPAGSQIGMDGLLFSVSQVRHLQKECYPKELVLRHDLDLLSGIWLERPPLPWKPVFVHGVRFAGQPRSEKLTAVRAAMAQLGASHYLVSTLDDIAWVLNLRGADVDCNPVFVSYLLISAGQARLFIAPEQVSVALKAELNADGVLLSPYADVLKLLSALPDADQVLIDPATTSIRLYQALQEGQVLRGDNLVANLKAIKNNTEIAHIRHAMVKDGVALTRLFVWLQATLATRTVSEVELAERLAAFRQEQADYQGESFHAIIGYGANGAIIHYHAQPDTCAHIRPEGILLLDSGGQYLDGTTDITRTVALGPTTAEQRRHFTLVLKGYIGLDSAVFPEGTTGGQLDILARQHLWQAGLNYGHGTGHGVGFFLNVHEGPQSISPGPARGKAGVPLKAGMLTSNEPGFYLPGAYGIRTENLILCQQAPAKPGFLCFEPLSLFPIDARLVDDTLLTAPEKEWLGAYHARVKAALAPHLEADAQQWLAAQCAPYLD